MPDSGNETQVRMVAEQVADAAILKFTQQHPEIRKMEVPAPIKWASGVIAALFTAGIAGMAFWLVASVSDMKITLARVDERMSNSTAQYDDIARRVTRLETFHEAKP